MKRSTDPMLTHGFAEVQTCADWVRREGHATHSQGGVGPGHTSCAVACMWVHTVKQRVPKGVTVQRIVA